MTRTFFLAVAMLALTLAAPAHAEGDGATLYKRCAACHLPSGAGLPGAFPPLAADFRSLVTKAAGRRYVILAVTKGLSGAIDIEGKTYRGNMPAQSTMDDAAVAAVLNHVATDIAKAGAGFKPFTSAEVAVARASGASLTAAEVGALHGAAGSK